MSELFPTKTIALEYLSCTDQSREYEFNHWYNKIRLPELVKAPGVISVHRYRNIAKELREGQSRYLTLYRLSSDDPWGLMQRVTKKGQLIDCLQAHEVTVWDFLAYRRTVSPLECSETHLPDGMPEAMLVVPSICTDPARDEEFNDWYLYTHFHDLLEAPGMVQAHRYWSLKPNLGENDARYLALYEIDSDDPAAVVRKVSELNRDVWMRQGRLINCFKVTSGSGTYQHVDL